ncbi:MAG: amidase domain-containing protein [Thermoanaerobacter sp.]|nr:amidase domain-containing protein [Thermoanaerobacter sp.]
MWCNVDPLKEYIVNNTTNGTPSGYIISDITRLGVGDIIQYNLDSDSAFEHTGFIAYCYKDGLVRYPTVNTHTSDRRHAPWDSIPNTGVRFIRITGI